MITGEVTAEVGNWYIIDNNKLLFEVIDIDDYNQLIDVDHFDGSRENMTFNQWKSLLPSQVAHPEDWSGPYDLERYDLSADTCFNLYAADEQLQKQNTL